MDRIQGVAGLDGRKIGRVEGRTFHRLKQDLQDSGIFRIGEQRVEGGTVACLNCDFCDSRIYRIRNIF